jgi:hypothetical protein
LKAQGLQAGPDVFGLLPERFKRQQWSRSIAKKHLVSELPRGTIHDTWNCSDIKLGD